MKIPQSPDFNDAHGLPCDINVHANFDTCKLIYDYIHTRIMRHEFSKSRRGNGLFFHSRLVQLDTFVTSSDVIVDEISIRSGFGASGNFALPHGFHVISPFVHAQ